MILYKLIFIILFYILKYNINIRYCIFFMYVLAYIFKLK